MTKKANELTELQIQNGVIAWFDSVFGESDINGLLFAHLEGVMLGGKSARERAIRGAILKRAGMRRGIPDLFLAVARGGFYGLFLEIKKPGGVLSAIQKSRQNQLRAEGFCVSTVFSVKQAVDFIKDYLGGELWIENC